MEASATQDSQANRHALVPLVILLGIGSVVCSFAISNYLGMALAITALLISHFSLKRVSQTVWVWCISLASTGLALGLAALFMRILVDVLRG
jgi:Flp pilus assembly protein protease CpaA